MTELGAKGNHRSYGNVWIECKESLSKGLTYVLHATVNIIYNLRERRKCMQYCICTQPLVKHGSGPVIIHVVLCMYLRHSHKYMLYIRMCIDKQGEKKGL